MKKVAGLIACMLSSSCLFADYQTAGDQSSSPAPATSMPTAESPKSFHTISYVEYLYWKYTSALLDFGRDGVGLTNSAPQNQIAVAKTGKSFSPDFKYDSGFRVGLGFAFGPSKAFDWVARYTWFYTNPHKSVDNFSASFLPLNWLNAPSLTSPTYQSASLGVEIHYYYPEMQLGYTFKVNPYLSLRPYMALTSIVIDAGLKAKYNFTNVELVSQSATTKGECFSWSIGPKIGLDFTARLKRAFSIYCGVNFTQQAAQIDMNTQQTTTVNATGVQTVIQKGELSEVRSVPLFGFEIGPVWDQWFCKDKYHFQLRPVWQLSTLGAGNISFLNNNNVDVGIAAELRGFNIRALFDF